MSCACVVAALYHFAPLDDLVGCQKSLLQDCQKANVLGTLLLAPEGINGTIAGSRSGIDQVLTAIRSHPTFKDLEWKESYCEENPFHRLKVKLKNEIVTLGVDGVDPTVRVGQYVEPEAWDALLEDPDVLLIDTRNHYECQIGSFKGAIDPKTENFRDFPAFVDSTLDPKRDKKIAMFCTGGIRCEKASSYLLQQGFESVYHLKGGILKYLEHISEDQGSWEGECFVFDDRVAVTYGLEVGHYDQCHACRVPLSELEKQSPHYQPGISCHRCIDQTTSEQKQSFTERQKQMHLARLRGEKHLGQPDHRKSKSD